VRLLNLLICRCEPPLFGGESISSLGLEIASLTYPPGQAGTLALAGGAREERPRNDIFKVFYWLIFPAFFALMLYFVWPTMGKSLTLMALLLVTFLILTPTDHRFAVLTFVAGSALGYFLERWGTTRECWTYYTLQKPPFFAVLAHGMAAVAFWRAGEVVKMVWGKFYAMLKRESFVLGRE